MTEWNGHTEIGVHLHCSFMALHGDLFINERSCIDNGWAKGATAPAQVQNTLTAQLRAASLHMSQTHENAITMQSVSKTHGGDWIKATWIWSDAYFHNFYHICFLNSASQKWHLLKSISIKSMCCFWICALTCLRVSSDSYKNRRRADENNSR